MKPKSLSDLSLEELWQLFPIVLVPHRDCWADWYEEEAELLHKELPHARISHIGSTAIEAIRAKPTVDILVEVTESGPLEPLKGVMERCGYICMSESHGRIDFNKGYTLQGFAERVFHLHLRRAGDNDELYFRDFLRSDVVVAKEYERLKLDLQKRYRHDRDAYTRNKGDFVKRYTEIGRRLFAGRYGR